LEGRAIDEAHGEAEGDLGEVYEEEEPCHGGDEFLFGETDEEEVESGDWSCGVGDHGGDSCQGAGEPEEASAVRESGGEVRFSEAEDLEGEHAEDHGADDWFEGGVRRETEDGAAGEDPDEDGPCETADVVPEDLLAEESGGEDVSEDEEREDSAAGGFAWDDLGHEDDGHHADAGEA